MSSRPISFLEMSRRQLFPPPFTAPEQTNSPHFCAQAAGVFLLADVEEGAVLVLKTVGSLH